MIVDRGDIRTRRTANLANGDVFESARREQLRRRLQESSACLEIVSHSVRLKSSVPPAIATIENTSRNPRS